MLVRVGTEVQEVSRSLTRDLLRVIAVSGAAIIALTGVTVVRIWQQGLTDERRPVDAIVVLGAAQYDGTPSPVFEARLQHAVELFRSGFATSFVVTGGKLPADRTTESAVARQYAIDHGVPAASIYGENQAHNTLDSLRQVARLMQERGQRSALFVSDPTHLLRVLRIAQDLGIEAYGSATPTSPVASDPMRAAKATIHELGALGVYFLTGATPSVEHTGK